MVSKRGRIKIIKLPLICVTRSFHSWLEKLVPETKDISVYVNFDSVLLFSVLERGQKKSETQKSDV